MHEHEHGEDPAEALGQLRGVGHPVRDPRVADLALRAHQPLGHRRFGHEERPRDLGGVEAADGAEGERDPRLDRQRRVGAGEDEPQPVVPLGLGRRQLGGVVRRAAARELVHRHPIPDLADLDAPTAQHVERAALRDRREPGPGRARHALGRPVARRALERVGGGVLGHVPVAGRADEGRDDARPLLAVRGGDGLGGRAGVRLGPVLRRARRVAPVGHPVQTALMRRPPRVPQRPPGPLRRRTATSGAARCARTGPSDAGSRPRSPRRGRGSRARRSRRSTPSIP